ncbi:MAG: hypothetical protein R6U50_00880, partial [Desulfobacterales bacterium]
MKEKNNPIEKYVRWILENRFKVLLVIALITVFFGYKVAHLKVATDFFTLYPPKHAYIELYNEYRKMFGSANVLVCAVEVKEGDIYTVETIAKIDRITQALLATEGCDALQLVSITHPKLKNVQVSAWGITMEPVMYPGLPTDQAGLVGGARICFTDYDREMALVVDYRDPGDGEHRILGVGRWSRL